MSVLDNIKEKIQNSNSILILTHENPDGDAIGSSLAMYNALKKMEKKCLVYIPQPDKTYSYLSGYDEMMTGPIMPINQDFDLVIALDSSDLNRLGNAVEIFNEVGETICVDHHITNQNFATINFVNAVASSTCENLMVIFAGLEVSINKEIAECLYTGILTDTGGFRYSCSPETMELVATLMETGINTNRIYRVVYDITTFNRTKLYGRCIDRLELLHDGKIAFTYMNLSDLQELNLEESDSDRVVYFGRDIDTVEVSIFAKEREDGVYKLSLRANEYVDVSVVASKFGGGGHARAAGCESSLPLEQVKQVIVEEIEKQLNNNNNNVSAE
jgi:phosphoesterase RecJ-like protein